MLTRTKVKDRIPRKTNPVLRQTIDAALREKSWISLAKMLSSSTKHFPALNLSDIESQAKDNSVVVVPGKVLSSGSLSKKVSIYALSFSKSAETKLQKSKVDHGSIVDLIKQNQKANGVQILK